MKKKFVLVLALVLLVASTAFAGDVKFSGRVRQGYVLTFTNGSDATITSQRAKEGKLALKVADADGLWALSFGDLNGTALDSNDKFGATATINFSTALTKAGVDMKDWTVSMGIGNTGDDAGLRAYNDVNGNGYDKIKNNGKYSANVTVGYGKIASVKVSTDPTSLTNKDDNGNRTSKSKSFAITALVNPVDGVKVAAGYGYNFVGGKADAAKNAIGGAVTVDIAKLASMKDFNLKVSAWDQYAFKDTSTTPETAAANWMQANIALGVAKVDGWVEYSVLNKTQNLNVQANFNLVKGMGLDAYFNLTTLNDADKMKWNVGGDVSYTFGGVVYSLNAEYNHMEKNNDKHTFALTPAVAISF